MNADGSISPEHRYPPVMRSSPWPPVETIARRADPEEEEHYPASLVGEGEQEVQDPAANSTPNATAAMEAKITQAITAKEAQDVSTSIGLMLLGMVTFTMSLFYATHFPDSDVQHTTWVTMSETMSLFCGVLLFTSFKDIMVLQFGELGGHHDSAPDLKSMIISLLRTLILFWAVQFMLLKYRRADIRLKAWSSIGGNVIAFASIDCFGMIQQTSPFRDNPANAFLGCVIAAFMVFCMCLSAHIVRHHYATCEDGIMKEHDLHWNEACKEVENRFAAICIGLLLSIVIRQSISGSMPAIWGSPRNKTQEQVNTLFGVSLGLSIPVFAMSMVVTAMEGIKKTLPGIVRSAKVLQLILSMSMGWSLVFCGQWEFWSSTHGKGVGLGDKMTARMCDALMFSYLSFGFIIFLDFLADKLAMARHGFEAVSQAFVLGLGLAWQGAFAEATTCLSHRFEDKHTRAYMDAWMTLGLCATVLPAWVLYMLPKALAGPQPLDKDAKKKEGEGGKPGEGGQAGEEGGAGNAAGEGEAGKSDDCPMCGTTFEEGAQFCQNCGYKKGDSTEPSGGAAQTTSGKPSDGTTSSGEPSGGEPSTSGAKGGGKAGAAAGKGRGGSTRASISAPGGEGGAQSWDQNNESWGGHDESWGGADGGSGDPSF